MPICRANRGVLTTPNIYELQYYCMSVMYKKCPVFKRSRSRTKAETKKKEKKNKDNDAIT